MKKAFTLAEVLITIAIIGVVAALTIPTLIQSYKKSVVETKLSQFYTMMNQAVKLSEIDNGEQSTWLSYSGGDFLNEYSIEEYFNKYFAPYLKVVKTETVNDYIMRVYLANGTFMSVNSITGRQNPHFLLYITNKTKDIIVGKDAFYFTQVFVLKDVHSDLYYRGSGIIPYSFRYSGWDNVSDDEINKILRDDKDYGCFGGNRAYCTALIMRNGWKIPKDYPFKF